MNPDKSIEKIPRMTFKESWNVIYWTFFYSRGDQNVQNYILEYFKRRCGFSFLIYILPIPRKIIRDTISFRKSPRHFSTKDGTYYINDKRLGSDSIKELRLQVEIIQGSVKHKESEVLKRLSWRALLSLLAEKIKKKEKEMSDRGFKNNNIEDFFLTQKKMPGGKQFELLRKDLFNLLKE